MITFVMLLTIGGLTKKHPNKEIRKAVEYAVSKKWRVTDAGSSSHAWARLKCSESSQDGCIISLRVQKMSNMEHTACSAKPCSANHPGSR